MLEKLAELKGGLDSCNTEVKGEFNKREQKIITDALELLIPAHLFNISELKKFLEDFDVISSTDIVLEVTKRMLEVSQ